MLTAGVGMVDMKLGTSLGRANLVKHLVVVAAIGDSLAAVLKSKTCNCCMMYTSEAFVVLK